jgi:hypothetical protein
MPTLTTALDVDPVKLQTTETIIIPTVPLNTEYNIPVIRFTNIDTLDHFITIYNYNNDTSGGDEELFIEAKNLTIQAGSTFEWGPIILPSNRVISATADINNKVVVRVHGWQAVTI